MAVGCSESDESSAKINAACFVLNGDWEAIGALQAQFVVGDSYLPGARGFELHLSPDYLELLLVDGVDALSWIEGLPSRILDDPVVEQVFPVAEGDCARGRA